MNENMREDRVHSQDSIWVVIADSLEATEWCENDYPFFYLFRIDY